MTYRALLFFLLLTGCQSTTEPETVTYDAAVDPAIVTVMEEPWPDDWSPNTMREITTTIDRYLAGSAAIVTSHMLSGAQTPVRWLQSEEAGFRGRFVKVIPAPGAMLTSDTLVTAYLDAIGGKLIPTDTAAHLIYLRQERLRENIVLTNTVYPGPLTEAESLAALSEAGIHVVNDTGHPLSIHPDALEMYVPALREVFGDSLATMPFFLSVDTLQGVRLVKAD